MPRAKVDYTFDIELMDSNKPTVAGNWYSEKTLLDIHQRIIMGTVYPLCEFSPLERELKKIPLTEVWTEKIMANSVSSRYEDGKLIITMKCVSNKNGKRLKSICDSIGIEKMKWFPVGYGNTVQDNGKNVVTDYTLIYISF